MNADQKSAAATIAYIMGILYLAHLGSRDVNRTLIMLMLAAGSVIVGILIVGLYSMIRCVFEDEEEEEL